MQKDVISEYISNEHVELLAVLREYIEQKKSSDNQGLAAFKKFSKQIQEHVGKEEAIFPLLQKAIETVSTDLDLLKKEHEAIRELVTMILQKMEAGSSTSIEEQALDTLLVNHMKSEKSVLSILDTHLNEEERKAAIENARRLLNS